MLEGEIRDIDLVARLVELWRQQFTGAIRFENDGIIKIIYFKGGDVLSASTNDRADSVDEILMRAGKVSREHVKQALAKRKENETLGDTLLNLGFITRKELTWARRVQVVGVIRSIGEWTAGSYTIVADYLPKRDEGTIFPLPQIIVEMVVTDQDRPRYERALESGSVVFTKVPDFTESYAKLGLNEEADAIAAQVDGARTASEVAAASHQDAFNAYKLLHGLSLLGLLVRAHGAAPATQGAEPVRQNEPRGIESSGVADAADSWSGTMPKFDLDDEPGAETTPLRTPSPPPLPPEPDNMPAWDTAPSGDMPSSAPAPASLGNASEEPAWGFDEAQIETSRRATLAPLAGVADTPRKNDFSSTATATRRPVPKTIPRKSHFALIVTLMALFILAAIGYYGFMWWAKNSAGSTAVVVRRPARKGVAHTTPAPPPASTATATTTTGSVAPATPPAQAASVGSTTTTSSATQTSAFTREPVVLQKPVVSQTATTTQTSGATHAVAEVAKKPAAEKSATPQPTTPPRPTAVTAASASDRDRYDGMARDFAAAPSGKFTVQFEIVCEPSNITKALSAGGTNVWFVPISIKGRSCYRVFWGHYPTRDAAERGMREIPANLREASPAVVAVPQS